MTKTHHAFESYVIILSLGAYQATFEIDAYWLCALAVWIVWPLIDIARLRRWRTS